jgi:hypothetical protein
VDLASVARLFSALAPLNYLISANLAKKWQLAQIEQDQAKLALI